MLRWFLLIVLWLSQLMSVLVVVHKFYLNKLDSLCTCLQYIVLNLSYHSWVNLHEKSLTFNHTCNIELPFSLSLYCSIMLYKTLASIQAVVDYIVLTCRIIELDRQLLCGNHFCHQVCHMGPCKSCSLLPSAVTACPCTQTKLSEMKGDEGSTFIRNSCLDPVPTCEKVNLYEIFSFVSLLCITKWQFMFIVINFEFSAL